MLVAGLLSDSTLGNVFMKMLDYLWNPILVVLSCWMAHALQYCLMQGLIYTIIDSRHQSNPDDRYGIIGVALVRKRATTSSTRGTGHVGALWIRGAREKFCTKPSRTINNVCLSFWKYHTVLRKIIQDTGVPRHHYTKMVYFSKSTSNSFYTQLYHIPVPLFST